MIVYHEDGKPREAFPHASTLKTTDEGIPLDLTGTQLVLLVVGAGVSACFHPSNVPGVDGRVDFAPGDDFLDGLPDRYSFELLWTNLAGETRTVLAETVERHKEEVSEPEPSDEDVRRIAASLSPDQVEVLKRLGAAGERGLTIAELASEFPPDVSEEWLRRQWEDVARSVKAADRRRVVFGLALGAAEWALILGLFGAAAFAVVAIVRAMAP